MTQLTRVLDELNEGPATSQDIADATGLPRKNAGVCLGRLVDLGCAHRKKNRDPSKRGRAEFIYSVGRAPAPGHRVQAHVRVALGSEPLRPGQPAEPCAYCWPAQVASDFYDSRGSASCYCCAQSGARVRQLPERRRIA